MMIKNILKKLKIHDNAGSTMVEVLVGFTILVIVLVECSLHLLNTAGNMIMKAKDMQSNRQTLNSELYQEDTTFESMDTDDEPKVSVVLTLDTDKTDSSNYTTSQKKVSISMDATVERYYSEKAGLGIIHVIRRTDTGSE